MLAVICSHSAVVSRLSYGICAITADSKQFPSAGTGQIYRLLLASKVISLNFALVIAVLQLLSSLESNSLQDCKRLFVRIIVVEWNIYLEIE